jgi:hypothetical protein
MTLESVNPLMDPRWPEFVELHPASSVFHTREWLMALHKTYGFRPVALSTSGPRESLADAIVLCQVKSWLTGHRMVSLPFSDHCEPLVGLERGGPLFEALQRDVSLGRCKYVEIRPASPDYDAPGRMEKAASYCFHRLNLQPAAEPLFRTFHKDCVQRKIRRSEREGLAYASGRSDALLRQFYRLMILTRRQHQLPPQPIVWFRNLIGCLGEKLTIHVALKGDDPVASILTLRHKKTLVYKYGCSDKRFNNLGGTHLLFWKAIQEAKADGFEEMDMGRSDWDNPGLLDFKDRWGAVRSDLVYYRYSRTSRQVERGSREDTLKVRAAKQAFSWMPDGVLTTAGRMLYRHLG